MTKKPINPFYPMLVIAGTAFCLTACAYGLMAMRELRPNRPVTVPSSDGQPSAAVASAKPHPLMTYLASNGEKLLLVELGFLALFSFAAMGTDGYWTRRAEAAAARGKSAAADKSQGEST
jgi:hypothetical protein